MQRENFDNLTYSPLIKGAFLSPLIHYIVNTDTNLINAITNENNNAASTYTPLEFLPLGPALHIAFDAVL